MVSRVHLSGSEGLGLLNVGMTRSDSINVSSARPLLPGLLHLGKSSLVDSYKQSVRAGELWLTSSYLYTNWYTYQDTFIVNCICNMSLHVY